jgi:hypothetical protein
MLIEIKIKTQDIATFEEYLLDFIDEVKKLKASGDTYRHYEYCEEEDEYIDATFDDR